MKRKILCLAACVACILAMLISCGKDECEAHVDADTNSTCDNCGVPVVILTEKVPSKEEAVDMIVSAIPENAKIGDVLVIDAPASPVFTEAVKHDKINSTNAQPVASYYIAYNYLEQVAGADTTDVDTDDLFRNTYGIYDPFANKDIVTPYVGDSYALADIPYVDSASVATTVPGIIKVSITDYTSDGNGGFSSEDSEIYYTLSGEQIAASHEDGAVTYPEVSYVGLRDGVIYVLCNDEKLAIDAESYTVIHRTETDKFIERPTFDYKTEKYGFVEMYDKIYVYDLDEWIKCVFAYDIPSNYAYVDTFYLANGTILTQAIKLLPSSSVNYDVLWDGAKADIVYSIVSVGEAEKQIEFGYYIMDVETDIDLDSIKENVKNIVTAYPIVNKTIAEKELLILTDDSLTILAEYNSLLPEFVDVSSLDPIAKDIFIGTEIYGEGSSVRKLYNAAGEEIVTLPNGAQVKSTYILNDGKYYNHNMELLFDPAADEDAPYTVFASMTNSVIFKKGYDFYLWDATKTAPVIIIDEISDDETTRQELVSYNLEGIVIKTTVEGVGGNEITYSLYNANGVKVLDSESLINSYTRSSKDDVYVWRIVLDDGSVYFAR